MRHSSISARRFRCAVWGIFLAAITGCGGPDGHSHTFHAQVSEPPPGLEFEPPPPGTYELPVIQEAVDGEVLAADGSRHRLYDYLGGRYAFLSFVYTRCEDSRGCPFATATFQMLRRSLEKEPRLADAVSFVSLSFDPENDTPEVMRRFGRIWGADDPAASGSWVFLTTASEAEISSILDGFGQYVVPETDAEGRFLGTFTHVLKVYLIDRERMVRNIYSTGFLHPELALNDLKTLLLGEESTS